MGRVKGGMRRMRKGRRNGRREGGREGRVNVFLVTTSTGQPMTENK